MIKALLKDEGIKYILTEKERTQLASEEAKKLLADKLSRIEEFADNETVDFFSEKEIQDGNQWEFNVEVNGKRYSCYYDNEGANFTKVQKEMSLLMWRYADKNDGFSYYETIGGFVCDDGTIFTVDDTYYNEVKEFKFDVKSRKDLAERVLQYEELDITEDNIQDVRDYFFR